MAASHAGGCQYDVLFTTTETRKHFVVDGAHKLQPVFAFSAHSAPACIHKFCDVGLARAKVIGEYEAADTAPGHHRLRSFPIRGCASHDIDDRTILRSPKPYWPVRVQRWRLRIGGPRTQMRLKARA